MTAYDIALDQAEAAAKANGDAADAAEALFVALAKMIEDLKVEGNIDPAVVARIEALASGLNARAAQLAAAVVAGTPAEAPPVEETPPVEEPPVEAPKEEPAA